MARGGLPVPSGTLPLPPPPPPTLADDGDARPWGSWSPASSETLKRTGRLTRDPAGEAPGDPPRALRDRGPLSEKREGEPRGMVIAELPPPTPGDSPSGLRCAWFSGDLGPMDGGEAGPASPTAGTAAETLRAEAEADAEVEAPHTLRVEAAAEAGAEAMLRLVETAERDMTEKESLGMTGRVTSALYGGVAPRLLQSPSSPPAPLKLPSSPCSSSRCSGEMAACWEASSALRRSSCRPSSSYSKPSSSIEAPEGQNRPKG